MFPVHCLLTRVLRTDACKIVLLTDLQHCLQGHNILGAATWMHMTTNTKNDLVNDSHFMTFNLFFLQSRSSRDFFKSGFGSEWVKMNPFMKCVCSLKSIKTVDTQDFTAAHHHKNDQGHILFAKHILFWIWEPNDNEEKKKNLSSILSPFTFRTLSTRCCSKAAMLMMQQWTAASHYLYYHAIARHSLALIIQPRCAFGSPSLRSSPQCVTVTWIGHTLLLQQINAWFV